jgi:hypothetical protein
MIICDDTEDPPDPDLNNSLRFGATYINECEHFETEYLKIQSPSEWLIYCDTAETSSKNGT